MEGAVRLFLDDNPGRDRHVRWSVILIYPDTNTGRPSGMIFLAECYDYGTLVYTFIGHNNN
jgi:hypothetical protein